MLAKNGPKEEWKEYKKQDPYTQYLKVLGEDVSSTSHL